MAQHLCASGQAFTANRLQARNQSASCDSQAAICRPAAVSRPHKGSVLTDKRANVLSQQRSIPNSLSIQHTSLTDLRRNSGHRGFRVTAAAASASSTSTRIADVFVALKEKKQCAFIPFLCAGDGGLETTKKALLELDAIGADVIELGVPYSDPLADGPTIQAAATRALNAGTTLDMVLDLVRDVAPQLKAPLVLFTYINPIMSRGYEAFIKEVASTGAAGLLVPDIPLEETVPLQGLAQENGIELVLLSTPTTPSARQQRIAEGTSGFLYLVSVTGVTGMKSQMESRVEGLVDELKGYTDKPICVGFGVSKAEQAQQLEAWGADGVIVGSALVKTLGEAGTPEEGLAAMSTLATELRGALVAKA